MNRSLQIAALLSGTLMVGVFLGASSSPRPAHAGAAAQAPIDPNKKMPGDACKSSDECQKHHSCAKVGDKSVCQAPPAPRLPPGAVT
jgi:hypothetical protein